MINNLLKAAHELIFNRRISNMNSNTVQGAIDELKGTLGYTKKNHFKYITDGFTYNGIVAQRNSDGSMSVTGTATDTVDYQIGETIAPDNEQYILSGYTEGADADCNIYAAYWEDDSTWLSAEAVLDDKGVLVTKAKGNLCKACLHVAKGKTVNIKFYPMVRYASVKDGTYKPYVEDVKTYMDNHSLNKVVKIVSTTIVESNNAQIVTIPNYRDYNALFIKIYSDANNGSTLYIPKCLFEYAHPFSIYSTNSSELVNQSGYAMRVQGEYDDGQIKVYFAGFTGWTSCYVTVDGIK